MTSGLVRALVEEGYRENTGEWAGEAERQWKQRTMAGRKAKGDMDRKDEISRYRVNSLQEAQVHHRHISDQIPYIIDASN